MTRPQRSDAARNRAAVLVAADELFATAAAPARLSMDDVAAAVCFLASDEASYITGHVLDVNGGMFMGG